MLSPFQSSQFASTMERQTWMIPVLWILDWNGTRSCERRPWVRTNPPVASVAKLKPHHLRASIPQIQNGRPEPCNMSAESHATAGAGPSHADAASGPESDTGITVPASGPAQPTPETPTTQQPPAPTAQPATGDARPNTASSAMTNAISTMSDFSIGLSVRRDQQLSWSVVTE